MLTYKKITEPEMEDAIECGGFVFVRDFDSGNLGNVEQVLPESTPSGVISKTGVGESSHSHEFNIMTRPDCHGTEFENGNRTWFYFGVRSAPPSVTVKLNLVNLNRQGKMYSQGMAPVTKTVPGKPHWERIKDKPAYYSDDNIFTLSFKFQTPEKPSATTYFAFTYPYTYTELQNNLNTVDARIQRCNLGNADDIYYHRECVCYSLDKRRVDLLTITSQHGKTDQREDKLKNLFPEGADRPFKFLNKKIIFISARVHPGETPSSFVFNGFFNLLLNRTDPVAVALRRLYVFKLIPFLNPDGVARGHYRTDTRGVNLNRVYQTPSIEHHPTVYAARALIRYHHYGFEKYDDAYDKSETKAVSKPPDFSTPTKLGRRHAKKVDQENMLSNKYDPKDKKKGIPMDKPSNHTAKILETSRVHKIKLPIDSEDDTSCSMMGGNPTLADQVEELNINQSSLDCFNITPSDNECAVDNVIDQSNYSNASNLIECDDTSLDTSNMTYDDDNDVIVSKFAKKKKSKDDNQINKNSVPLSLSACLRLNQAWCKTCRMKVKDLDAKMPGISQMLSGITKHEGFVTASPEIQNENVLCVNCHQAVLEENGNEIINTGIKETTVSNNNVIPGIESSNSLPFQKDVNKNNMKNKELIVKHPQRRTKSFSLFGRGVQKEKESDLYLYIDLHGHASKKGIFMYGNHFEEIDNSIECMLLPRIMSLNNLHFHFSSCNFTERNMYLKDRRDGMSREGSGRVAVLKATGLMRSYTLECNYNTGRMVNVLPPTMKETLAGPSPVQMPAASPPKYTPHIFEEVGKSLGSSILDLTGSHPNSRIPASEHRNLHGIREWLKIHCRQIKPTQLITSRQTASACSHRPNTSRSVRSHMRTSKQPNCVDPERKENVVSSGYQSEPRIGSSRMLISSSGRPITAPKMLPMRIRGEQPLSAKSQRNLSLISIKKPSLSKHPPTFKSPGPKTKFSTKQKSTDEPPDIVKGSTRGGLTESNRGIAAKQSFKGKSLKGNFKVHKESVAGASKQSDVEVVPTTSTVHRKAKIRTKEGLYPRQSGSMSTSKPLSKRLKVSQYIKYSDNAKEKYRIRKPDDAVEGVSSPVSSEDMVLSWDPAACVAGSSGATGPRSRFKPRKTTSLRSHLPSSPTPDLGSIRHKFG